MTQRNMWTFEYRGETIRGACKKKLTHHEERLAWWEAEKEKAKDALQASMELREQQVTGGTQHHAVFDQEKQARYNQCSEKIKTHRSEIETLTAFHRALELNPLAKLPLDVSDIAYFEL